jgi:hypothetical protein
MAPETRTRLVGGNITSTSGPLTVNITGPVGAVWDFDMLADERHHPPAHETLKNLRRTCFRC